MRWKIIKQFSTRNTLGFTFQDVAREFPEKNRIYLGRILSDMVHKGMLGRISRDNYHIIPFNADPDTYIPDRHQLAKYVMLNKEYYIGYASALEIHGLKSRDLSLPAQAREYVVTNRQVNPAIRSIGEAEFHFILHGPYRFFGFDSMWINQLEQAMVSDLEKTIVDIATKPQLGGGIIEVGNAIFYAKEQIEHDKLFYYFSRNQNNSAKKRFLFLTELLDLEWTDNHKRLMEELGTGISLLDPSAPDQGTRRIKFGLKINVDPIFIKEEVFHRTKF